MMMAPEHPLLQVICFSMDRPWQVSEYLRTLHAFLRVDLSVVWILFKASDATFREGYTKVIEAYPQVHWTEESQTEEHSFGHGLLSILDASTSEFVLFGVDDAFFFDSFPLLEVLTSPLPQWNVLHLTLNPNIWYSETQQVPLLPLPSMIHHGDVLTFDSGRGEWNYPWEVSGSVFRRPRVVDMLDAIRLHHGMVGLSQPNRLENNGVKLVTSFHWVQACMTKPIMHVMAINQVQQLYDNPLLAQHETLHLLSYLAPPRHLDTTWYRATVFRSVHIGTLVLQEEGHARHETPSPPLVTIVLPAFNESKFIGAALESLLAQTYRRFEVLVVDDCSTDETVALVRAYKDPRIRLLQNPTNLGVARTLNRGLALAQGAFVARMDGDDVALPERLAMQVAFLQSHPDIDLVGSAIGLIGPELATSRPCKVVVYPTTASTTRWQMWMGSMLAHPTVLFRRELLITFTYDETLGSGEDYDLWLRLLHRTPPVRMLSLGTPLLLHRKHGANASTRKRDQQRREANASAHGAIQACLGRPVPLDVVTLVRGQVDDDTSPSIVKHAADAIQLLVDLKHTVETTDAGELAAIEADAMARHGELAFRAMVHNPTTGVLLWQKWVTQNPTESRMVFERLTNQHAQPAKGTTQVVTTEARMGQP
ncbi:Aste57867_15608 [Aphanomyces stellatus]|uniref:Aste57867_15608 protein n=1 Tax=Aphanomyces stellatus TaxID=120398 RepID=A0A485L4U8_9STRA|nr:hypothetical protein As57867_015552 [Aphanomyces stellatus]VFT92409.1 Aste57867_15608 [Aphanomyces stellatus]